MRQSASLLLSFFFSIHFCKCRAKNRGDSGNMNRIITLFIRLATCLEEGSKSSNGREEMVRRWKDESPSGLCSSGSKYKKKLNKIVTERKHRSNGGSDYGEYASDREIRRRLSKLNKKSMDSGSDTSDDLDRSSEGGSSGSESTASDTESDLDFRSEGGVAESRVDGYFTADEGLYSMTDDREWGARMTKVSLVPPVTRKYEVIEQYVIVADEDEVQRKMKVSLPEHYNEKLTAQKNGTEESDMEIPEVKDYKPRKQLGDEVIEQEVYGIDPYTHNLLLDSMPEELDWPLLEKHLFIEEVLLCTLNKQVRHFTGTGNTPMMYHLQPVVEDIQKTAEEELDLRTLKMCQGILKAMNSRPDDNYVAYRKVTYMHVLRAKCHSVVFFLFVNWLNFFFPIFIILFFYLILYRCYWVPLTRALVWFATKKAALVRRILLLSFWERYGYHIPSWEYFLGHVSFPYYCGVMSVFPFVFTKLYVKLFKMSLFSNGLQKQVGMTVMLLVDINLCSVKG